MKIYKEILLDHYKNPRHKGVIAQPDIRTQQYNPSCGDEIKIDACVVNGILIEAAFQGTGCVISQAAASLLLEACIGKRLDEINALIADDMRTLLGIDLGPTRLRCAMLALHALHEGIAIYQKKERSGA